MKDKPAKPNKDKPAKSNKDKQAKPMKEKKEVKEKKEEKEKAKFKLILKDSMNKIMKKEIPSKYYAGAAKRIMTAEMIPIEKFA